MDSRLYVHLSEPGPVYLSEGRAVTGYRALAGMRLEAPPAPLSAADWRRRLMRFLLALSYADEETAPWWMYACHVRVVFPAREAAPRVSLWVGLTAPSDWQAESAACDLCAEIQTLLPPELEPEPVCTPEEFEALWGRAMPPMLWAVRPAERQMDEAAYQVARCTPDWAAMQQVILLARRLPGPVWLNFTFHPVSLPPGGGAALRAAGLAALAQENALFALRQQVAGTDTFVHLAARALAAAQTPAGSRLWGRMQIVEPVNPAEWQAAQANWEWGSLRPWGNPPRPDVPLHLRLLVSVRQAAALLAPWCIA